MCIYIYTYIFHVEREREHHVFVYHSKLRMSLASSVATPPPRRARGPPSFAIGHVPGQGQRGFGTLRCCSRLEFENLKPQGLENNLKLYF